MSKASDGVRFSDLKFADRIDIIAEMKEIWKICESVN